MPGVSRICLTIGIGCTAAGLLTTAWAHHSASADLLLQPVPGDPRAGGETDQEPGRSRALNAHHVSTAGRLLPAFHWPWARPEPIPDGQAGAGEMEQFA